MNDGDRSFLDRAPELFLAGPQTVSGVLEIVNVRCRPEPPGYAPFAIDVGTLRPMNER